MTIIGVVPELKYRGLPDNPTADPDLFMPIVDRGQQTLVIRTTQAPATLAPGVRAALRDVSRAIVPFAVRPMDELVRDQTAPSRFTTWVLGFFAAGTMVGIGSIGAWQMSRLIEAQLFGVKASDSSSLVAVATLAVVALAACVVPAVRATRVAPVTALRNE